MVSRSGFGLRWGKEGGVGRVVVVVVVVEGHEGKNPRSGVDRTPSNKMGRSGVRDPGTVSTGTDHESEKVEKKDY